MRIIAVMNQKGGVGKTTTSVNLAAGLARAGRRVCLIDLDPQGHSSLHLGIEPSEQTPTVYDVFAGEATLASVRRMVAPLLIHDSSSALGLRKLYFPAAPQAAGDGRQCVLELCRLHAGDLKAIRRGKDFPCASLQS